MAVIYLQHEKHGQKVACSDIEAQMDRANGWVDYDPSPKQVDSVPDFLAPSSEPVVEPPKVKRPKP